MSAEKWASFWLGITIVSLIALGMLLGSVKISHAKDNGQWGDVDPAISAWYRSLRQPDSPLVSCCGEADSYYCDEHSQGSQVYCIINDDRDNEKLMRTPFPNGTRINIPPNKLNHDPNLEGRAIVFLNSGGNIVYCFIGAGGF